MVKNLKQKIRKKEAKIMKKILKRRSNKKRKRLRKMKMVQFQVKICLMKCDH